MPGILIIIPTYNERENIRPLLDMICGIEPAAHLLIVDDNSPDQTAALAEQLQDSAYPGRLFLLKRSGKLGLGTAYVAGFKWALARGYDYIFEMDADFSHDPRYLPEFLAAIQTSDVVLGSRYIPGGGVKNWGLVRRLVSQGGSLYARTILGLSVRDLTGGFKCFRREVLLALDLDEVSSNGYSFQIEITYRAWKKGFRIQETPIVFEDRRAGKSKMSRRIFWEAVWMVWRLRLDSAVGA